MIKVIAFFDIFNPFNAFFSTIKKFYKYKHRMQALIPEIHSVCCKTGHHPCYGYCRLMIGAVQCNIQQNLFLNQIFIYLNGRNALEREGNIGINKSEETYWI